MRPEWTPNMYEYYTFKDYRLGNNNYYMHRIISPFRRNNIISAKSRENIASRLIEQGAACIDTYTIDKGNSRFVDCCVYRMWKRCGMKEGK